MISYDFPETVTTGQKDQLLALYRAEDWWKAERLFPKQIDRIILGSHCLIIAKKGDEVIGMGRALSDGTGDAYLHDITVKKTYRGQGIGKEMIRRLVKRLTGDGITWIGLIAERNSSGFYQTNGFKIMDNASPLYFEL